MVIFFNILVKIYLFSLEIKECFHLWCVLDRWTEVMSEAWRL